MLKYVLIGASTKFRLATNEELGKTWNKFYNVSLKLDKNELDMLDWVQMTEGVSKSSIVREALAEYCVSRLEKSDDIER